MSNTKQDYDIDMSKPTAEEGDIAIAQAIPQPNSNEPPIPAGHARFYCSKCHTVRRFGYISLVVCVGVSLKCRGVVFGDAVSYRVMITVHDTDRNGHLFHDFALTRLCLFA